MSEVHAVLVSSSIRCYSCLSKKFQPLYKKHGTMNEFKKNLLDQLDKRVQDKILEPTNAELLKKLIMNAGSDNEAMMIAELGTTYRRTGLHFDKRLEKMTNDIHYFKKNEVLSFHTEDNKPVHKLIIGDNYEALQNLLIQYRSKVDVIYIDPPYGKDSMGEFAQTNYQNAITRDNLLSMLYPRLMLAKMLLGENGVIFCSIDIRNYAYVKCLFDEVFGEANSITTLNWKKKKQPSFLSRVAAVMEYVLVYAKNGNNIKKLSVESISDSNKPVINSSNTISERIISKGIRSKADTTFIKKGTYTNKSMTIEYLDDVQIVKGRTMNDFRCKAKFRTGQDNIDQFCKEDLLFITKNLGLRRDLSDDEKEKSKAITDLLLDWGQNQDGTDELKSIFDITDDINIFDNPKPVSLIANLLKSTMYSEPVVLDFFGGSGTTGQAVLEVCLENAQFILCQLNENLDEALKSATNKDKDVIEKQISLCEKFGRPHELSEITAERLRRVMTGKTFDGSSNFEWAKKNKPYGGNLDVYEIGHVANFESTKGKTPFDVIDETLYGQKHFDHLSDKVKWVCENFSNTQKQMEE